MDSKTWWIIIAIIVVILILVLIAVWQGKRRTAARREKAQELRGRAKDNEDTVVESRQRAESASAQAERARAEAEAKQRQAEQLALEAEHERKAAAAVERDHAETLRKADRLDPDTPTDRHGNRVVGTESGGDGESRIDPHTGQPVEEAARERDVHADRPHVGGAHAAAEGNNDLGHGSGHDSSYDDERPAAEDGAGDESFGRHAHTEQSAPTTGPADAPPSNGAEQSEGDGSQGSWDRFKDIGESPDERPER